MGRGLRLCVALPMNNAQGTPVPVEYPVRKRASVPSGIIIPLSKRNATVTLADVVVGLMQGMDTWGVLRVSYLSCSMVLRLSFQ